ncbi:MAG: hypothetical protein ACE5HE_13630, partial [Phycisphaerae bacterium]
MAEIHRRVILKPPNLRDDAAAKLRATLTAAVEANKTLGRRSPHVLQLLGDLQENEQAFFIEHEPASPRFLIPDLFDPGADCPPPEHLKELAWAVFDALRAAHISGDRQAVAHGGLCPGVVLTSADGISKVADFGFAPAICSALGVEEFLNLAVGPNPDLPADAQGTAAWEVLSPDEFERDDRICAFIDPDKYRERTLHTFERASDIIAAGFLLHLFAEHGHPYLYNDPEAHRHPTTSEFIAFAIYNGARRPELRGSTDPGINKWCELVARMLANLPRERPTADELVKELAPHVTPLDPAELLTRKLNNLRERVKQHIEAAYGIRGS